MGLAATKRSIQEQKVSTRTYTWRMYDDLHATIADDLSDLQLHASATPQTGLGGTKLYAKLIVSFFFFLAPFHSFVSCTHTHTYTHRGLNPRTSTLPYTPKCAREPNCGSLFGRKKKKKPRIRRSDNSQTFFILCDDMIVIPLNSLQTLAKIHPGKWEGK